MSESVSSILYAMGVSAALAGSAFTAIQPHLPRAVTADYFEVRSIEARRAGDTAELEVDRVVHTGLPMSYTVRVFRVDDRGAHLVCAAQGGPYQYRTDAVLPDPVTLAWWTDGRCVRIPPGAVDIDTTWTPLLPGLEPVSVSVRVKE